MKIKVGVGDQRRTTAKFLADSSLDRNPVSKVSRENVRLLLNWVFDLAGI